MVNNLRKVSIRNFSTVFDRLNSEKIVLRSKEMLVEKDEFGNISSCLVFGVL